MTALPLGQHPEGCRGSHGRGVARRDRDLPQDNCSNSPGSGCGGVSQTARPEPAGGGLASRRHQATHWMLSAPGRGMGGPTELCAALASPADHKAPGKPCPRAPWPKPRPGCQVL